MQWAPGKTRLARSSSASKQMTCYLKMNFEPSQLWAVMMS